MDGVDGVASTHLPCDTRPIELGCTAIEALDPCFAVVDVGLGHRWCNGPSQVPQHFARRMGMEGEVITIVDADSAKWGQKKDPTTV